MSGKRPGWQYSDSLAVMIACAKATKDAPTLVLATLCRHANARGMCFPSMSTIARESDLPYATARRAVDRLVELGLIGRVVGGGRRANTYKLLNNTVATSETAQHGEQAQKLAIRSDATSETAQHGEQAACSPGEHPTRLIELKQEEPLKRVLPARSGTVGTGDRLPLRGAIAAPIAKGLAPKRVSARGPPTVIIKRSDPRWGPLAARYERAMHVAPGGPNFPFPMAWVGELTAANEEANGENN